MKKNLQRQRGSEKAQVKNTHFRSWKKGKKWLFASSLVVSIIGAGALESGKTVKADVTTDTIQVAQQVDQAAASAKAASSAAVQSEASAETTKNVEQPSAPSVATETVKAVESSAAAPVATSTQAQSAAASQATVATAATPAPANSGAATTTNAASSAAAVAATKAGMDFAASIDATTASSGAPTSQQFADLLSSAASYAKTPAGSAAFAQLGDKLQSAANLLSEAGSLANDPAVLAFKKQLSDAAADPAKQRALIAEFNTTSQGKALNSLAAVKASLESLASTPEAKAMLNSLSSSISAASANATKKAAANSAAVAEFMKTDAGKKLLDEAKLAADSGAAQSSAAVTAYLQTADGKALLETLKSYADIPEFAAFSKAMTAAEKASDATAIQSLAASFFATDIGKAFADDLQKYEAKDSYKAMTKQINDAQDAVANELKSSISKASMSTSLAGFDLGGIVSGITGTIWNVVSWLATNINPVRLVPDLTGLGEIGKFVESLVGGAIGSTFYGTIATGVGGFGAFLVAGIPGTILNSILGLIPIVGIVANASTAGDIGWAPGITGWLAGLIGAPLGAYYGATSGPGLADKDGNLDTVVSGTALGSAIGALVGETLGDWIISFPIGTLVDGIAGFIGGVIGVIGLGIIVDPTMFLVVGWVTALTDTIATLVGTPIGSVIGGAIGGGIGAVASLLGLNLHLPNLQLLIKDVGSLPGISDLINTVQSLASKAGKLKTKDIKLFRGARFNPFDAIVSAQDGNGKDISKSNIKVEGNIYTNLPGKFYVKYSFVNEMNDNEVVTGYATVTVA
ncbi:hypothetical protein AUQ39_14330 [Lacticaseibacillus casei]|nr:hypothetical protein AUQ39_14330 [Lacticaseibacillus casei]